MFCSDLQLKNYKPTQFCDLGALVSVAYFIVENDVPSTVFANDFLKFNPHANLFDRSEFKRFRLVYRHHFEKEYCSNNSPFRALFTYLFNKRNFTAHREKKFLREKIEG
jgi:hypothetical protein